ncbi:MAG: amidohydrolase [Clostridiales bacterium]|nr:amidohydrolase [Candidatus Cacconaster stercorequi]
MTTLFKNALIYTPAGDVNGYLAVKNEWITYIGTERPEGAFDCEKDMMGKLLMPGLVNCHTHTPMTLLRGLGTDLPLQTWLFDTIFPVEGRLTTEDIVAGTRLGLLEMLRSGTTSFSDMYFLPDAMAQAILDSGIKANICQHVQAFDAGDTYGSVASARRMEELHKNFHGKGNGRIRVDACLHAEYTCFSEDVARGVADFARDNDLRMHIHLSETKSEHAECMTRHGGLTPAGWFEKMGVFDVPCTAAHCVWTTREDWEIFCRHGVTVAHNPTSNMKLGSGFAPIPEMAASGVNITIGTDGTASNNNLNMFEELHLAALIHNGRHSDASIMPARQVIEMATVNGAKAQGRMDTGVLEVGKRADIIAIDMDQPHLFPNLDTAGLVAYAAQGSDVVLTMVDGEILYENGTYLTLDQEQIMDEAKAAVKRLYA